MRRREKKEHSTRRRAQPRLNSICQAKWCIILVSRCLFKLKIYANYAILGIFLIYMKHIVLVRNQGDFVCVFDSHSKTERRELHVIQISDLEERGLQTVKSEQHLSIFSIIFLSIAIFAARTIRRALFQMN